MAPSRSRSAAGCRFCDISAHDAPATVVLEESEVLAFLDARPLFPGHALVIPRSHVETLGALPAELMVPVFGAAQRLALALPVATGAEGTFVAINNVVSQSVPHLHVHVVPRRRGDGLKGFFWPRHGYSDAAHQEETAAAIRRALAATGPPGQAPTAGRVDSGAPRSADPPRPA